MSGLLEQIGEENAKLLRALEAAQERAAYLEGALIEIRRRDLRYYGTVQTEQWAYDGPIGEYVVEVLEKLSSDAHSASSSL